MQSLGVSRHAGQVRCVGGDPRRWVCALAAWGAGRGGGGVSGKRCEGRAVRHDQRPEKLLPKERKGKIKKLISGSRRNVNFIRREKIMNIFIGT